MMKLYVDYSKNLPCKYSIYVSFNYNPNYVKMMQSLKTRVFDNNIKKWEVAYECYSQLIGTLNNYNIPYNGPEFFNQLNEFIEQIKKKKQEEEKIKPVDVSILDNTEFKTEPRDYQKYGIAYGLTNDCFLLADQMGLGKSLQCANIARLKRGGQHCLVIVGYDALQFNWVEEIRKHTDEDAWVLGQQQKKNGRWVKGTMEQRINDLNILDQIEPFFIITSVSTLRYSIKKEYIDKKGKKKPWHDFIIADKIDELCKQGIIGRVIFDEAQVVKNIDSQQTTALLRIKSPKYKIIATGTPIMNKHVDLYPIMNWLGKEDSNFYAFRNTYCEMGGFKGKQIIGNKNGDILNRKLATFMLRRKKDEVLNLPDKIIIDEFLDMDLKQEKFYDQVKKKLKADMAKMKGNKTAVLAMMIALRKITCHPKWVDDKYKDSVKFERLTFLLNEIVENNQKAIIFSNWATPIEMINEQFKIYNPAMIIGDTKDRMEQVKKFQEDDTCKIIIGTIGAMGTGLTLTAASNVIFIDEPWNRALKDQCTDRAHRLGTKSDINVYTFICKNTFDEFVHKTVLKKGAVSDNVIDGISLEELTEYLD